ncbi:MAG: 50S ribosomal protein L10 [Gemmatimonadetes bacterium]|nr:50S ribosomal protein L10 [Gemmatimonadota bacterium]
MNLEQKQEVVVELRGKLGNARAFYLTDFTGLSVKRITELRRRLRDAGVEYVVVKNTLAQRALAGLDLPDVGRFFTGPTGVAITDTDVVAAAKVLDEFARENDNKPAIKAGVVEHRAVSAPEVARLAKLPSREQLLAELAGLLQAPLAQMLFVLQGKASELVGLLEALRAQREAA